MLAEEPNDQFLRYSLAMEHRKEQSLEEAEKIYRSLMQDTPPHVPSFFMLGQVFAETGKINEARAALRDGIEQARAQGDSHAAGEMAELLMALGEAGE